MSEHVKHVKELHRARLALERETMPLAWHYLSFASAHAFLGAVIIRAHGIADAVMQTHQRGINPGGEVLCRRMPDEHVPAERFRNKLLTRAQLDEAFVGDGRVMRLDEAAKEGLFPDDKHELATDPEEKS